MFFSEGKLEKRNETGHDMILKYENATYTTFRTYQLTRIPQLDMHINRLVNEQTSVADVRRKIQEAMRVFSEHFQQEFRVYCFSKAQQIDFFAEPLPTPPNSADFGCYYAVRENPTIKSVEWAHARCKLEERKSDLCLNEIIIHDDYVKEGLSSNVYIVYGRKIITAPSEYVLSGATRQMLLDYCFESGIEVEQRLFCVEELRSADFVFVTSTSRGVLPAESVIFDDESRVSYRSNADFVAQLRSGLEHRMCADATDVFSATQCSE